MFIEFYCLVKFLGIGCLLKMLIYFLSNFYGFNLVYGCMLFIVIGVNMVNKELIYLGVLGDGDMVLIGMG